jgi:type VI secretion system secreted protein VgrG
MINYSQAQAYVIKPALDALALGVLEPLLTGTLAHESLGGTYLSQLGGGPAMGPFQMEGATHDDIWTQYLPHESMLTSRLMILCSMSTKPKAEMLRTNLLYAAAMCAILYKWRLDQHRQSMPQTIEDCAKAWKQYYNTVKGKGTVEQWIEAYNKYVGVKPTKKAASA